MNFARGAAGDGPKTIGSLAGPSHVDAMSVVVLIALLACMLGLTQQAMEVQSAVRATVAGEGMWSKAEKDAVFHLARYAATGDERFFREYERAIAVPLSDRAARFELLKPEPDPAIVRRALEGGGVHPADVERLARFFRRFKGVSSMAQAISIWNRGDADLDELVRIADELHAATAARLPERQAEALQALEATNGRLTLLEAEFSSTLGDAARQVQTLVVFALLLASLLLATGAIVLQGKLRGSLRSSREQLRGGAALNAAILDAALDGVVTIDHESRIVEFNRAAERLFGVSRDAALGRDLGELCMPPSLQAPHRMGMRHYLDRGEAGVLDRRFESEGRRADGEHFPVELSVTRIPGSEPPLFAGFVRDLTERREHESALRASEEKLRQGQKMEAVGRLAGGIAHDFNNLLTVVLGYADLLLESFPIGSEQRTQAFEIKRAAGRATELTQGLLAFGRKQLLQPRPLDLNAFVDEMRGMLQRLIGEDVVLRVVAESIGATVLADASQLTQVILNLAVNARDAMPAGGELRIETYDIEALTPDDAVSFGVPTGPYVVLAVSDSGIGMDASTMARAFEPFYTTKDLGKGTGLGLATVHGIVLQSGGGIRVQSTPGVGTRFEVALPRAVGTPATPAPAAVEPARPRPSRGGAVLVVEDEAAVSELIAQVLERNGHTVVAARNSDDAIAIAGDTEQELALLITDMVMPAMGGRDLAAAILARRPGLPVLYISGYTQEEMLRGELPPSSAFLAKPFEGADLMVKINTLLEPVPSEV